MDAPFGRHDGLLVVQPDDAALLRFTHHVADCLAIGQVEIIISFDTATVGTPPVRLRRWTAAYFAAAALCHLWYMPIFFLTSSEDIVMADLVGGLLDSMTVFPLAIIVMLNMLQDRRRPLWPIALMIAPFVVGGVFSVATLSYTLIPMLYVYLLAAKRRKALKVSA